MKNTTLRPIHLSLLILSSCIILFSSCSSELSFDDYINNPVEFEKKEYANDKMEFTISLPNNWKIDDTYDSLGIFSYESFKPMKKHADPNFRMQVTKYLGSNNELDAELENLNKSENLPAGFEKIASEKTSFMFKESQYSHVQSSEGNQVKMTLISFIMEAPEDSTFFMVLCAVPNDIDQLENMSVLLSCAKDFKF